VISPYEGEKAYPKKNIEKVVYDAPERNFVALGDAAMTRREYEKAYFYYKRANGENPRYSVARERMNYVTGYLFRKEEEKKLSEIERKRQFEETGGLEARVAGKSRKELESRLGIKLREEANRCVIDSVRKNSPAAAGGLKKGDKLISVWGRLTGYMSKEDVTDLILDESPGEIKAVVEREVAFGKKRDIPRRYTDIIGARLGVEFDGLTVVEAESANGRERKPLKKGDLISAINGKSTRYMPFNNAVKIIEARNNRKVILKVRRNITVWRE